MGAARNACGGRLPLAGLSRPRWLLWRRASLPSARSDAVRMLHSAFTPPVFHNRRGTPPSRPRPGLPVLPGHPAFVASLGLPACRYVAAVHSIGPCDSPSRPLLGSVASSRTPRQSAVIDEARVLPPRALPSPLYPFIRHLPPLSPSFPSQLLTHRCRTVGVPLPRSLYSPPLSLLAPAPPVCQQLMSSRGERPPGGNARAGVTALTTTSASALTATSAPSPRCRHAPLWRLPRKECAQDWCLGMTMESAQVCSGKGGHMREGDSLSWGRIVDAEKGALTH